MATIAYHVTVNADRTLTVRVGRARESIALDGKTKAEIYEAVKWALVSKGAFSSEERLTEDLHDLLYAP